MSNDLKLRVLFNLVDSATKPLKNILAGNRELAKSVKDSRDQLKELGRVQKDVASFREMRAGVRATSTELTAAQARVNSLAAAMRSTSAPTKAMSREFDQAKAAAGKLKEAHEKQQVQLQQLRTRLSGAGVETRNLSQHERQLRTNVDATSAALTRQQARLTETAARTRKLAEARQKMEATQATAGRMAGTGAGMMAAGGGALYAGARVMAPGLQFEESMSSVQALARLEKTSEEYKALTKQARDLGAATSFTATEAANAQGFLAMAGFKTKAILDAMPGMLDLSKAGRTDLAQTADIASNILTGFGLQADQTSRLGDVLVGTFTRSNVNLQMLGDTMKYVAPVAAALGVDIETAAAMTGKLGDAGIQGSMAGTALRAVLSRLAAPPKMAADALQELNIKTADAAGNLRPIVDILSELDAKTKSMGNAKRMGFLKHIAGEEAASALNLLTKDAGSGALQELQTTLKGAQGEASKNAKTMADNARGDILSLKSAWEDFGITLFDSNNGPLRGVIASFTGIVRGIAGWAKENPVLVSTLLKVAAVVAVLVAAGGALMLMLASILGPIAIVKFGMIALGMQGGVLSTVFGMVGKAVMFLGRALLMNPIGLAITAIAVAAFLIYKYWEPIKAFFSGLWDQVKAAFAGGIGGVSALILNWSPLGLFYKAFSSVLSWFGVEMPATFSTFGANLLGGLIRGITGGLGAVKDAITNVASSTVGWFKEKLGIKSPSRVFGELGGFITQGAAIGMEGEKGRLAKAAGVLSLVATTAFGAPGIAQAAATPFSAANVAIDTRAPISARQAPAMQAGGGDTVQIYIQGGGLDPQAIAKAVAAELDRRDRAKQSRIGSRLTD